MFDEEIFAVLYLTACVLFIVLFIIIVVKDAKETLKDGRR